MQVFDILPPKTKTLQNTEQITGVEKPNKKPRRIRNTDLARSGEKNHRVIKISHFAPRKHPLCSGIKYSRITWDAEDANF